MNSLDLEVLKKNALENQFPYKLVDPSSIRFGSKVDDEGDIYINVHGVNLLANADVIDSLDEYYGISGRQKSNVEAALGETGVSALRNYLGAAASESVLGQKMALFADPKTKMVVNAFPVGDTLINPEQLFPLAEMMMGKFNVYPTKFHGGPAERTGMTLVMESRNPNTVTIAPGEVFQGGGFYLRWDKGAIDVGVFIRRMVCSNGAVISIPRQMGMIQDLSQDSINRLMAIVPKILHLKTAVPFQTFQKKALLAMETRASLAEMQMVYRLLRDNAGLPAEELARLAPFEEDMNAYAEKGYAGMNLRDTMSSMNVWTLYNNLTAYATHSTAWGEHDGRRDLLMNASLDFLNRSRDIKTHLDIFGKGK